MAKIFISYRRQDTGRIIPGIYNFIAEAFGPVNVFIDTKDIPDGEYFTRIIEQNLRDAKVMLVIIGNTWLGIQKDGHRRIDEQDDLVRAEVRLGLELARQGSLTLIPVLVDDTPMPPPQQLPSDISELHWRNAAQVHSSLTYFTDDINRLLDTISNAGVSREVSGRIEDPKDHFTYLIGVARVDGGPGQSPQTTPAPHPTPRSTGPNPPTLPNSPAPPKIPGPGVKLPVPAPTTMGKGQNGLLDALLTILFGLPGIAKGIIGLAVIVVVVVAVHSATSPSLTEHSTCQQFQQADSDAQTTVLQTMMQAHNTPSDQLQTTRFSLNLYCNVYGPSAPIDGIYNG